MFGGSVEAGRRTTADRRATRRFPIALPLQYKVFRGTTLLAEGIGRTMDISSHGILFHAGAHLEPYLRLELSIDWPMFQAPGPPMKLLVFGDIVRIADDEAAVRIMRHELRRCPLKENG